MSLSDTSEAPPSVPCNCPSPSSASTHSLHLPPLFNDRLDPSSCPFLDTDQCPNRATVFTTAPSASGLYVFQDRYTPIPMESGFEWAKALSALFQTDDLFRVGVLKDMARRFAPRVLSTSQWELWEQGYGLKDVEVDVSDYCMNPTECKRMKKKDKNTVPIWKMKTPAKAPWKHSPQPKHIVTFEMCNDITQILSSLVKKSHERAEDWDPPTIRKHAPWAYQFLVKAYFKSKRYSLGRQAQTLDILKLWFSADACEHEDCWRRDREWEYLVKPPKARFTDIADVSFINSWKFTDIANLYGSSVPIPAGGTTYFLDCLSKMIAISAQSTAAYDAITGTQGYLSDSSEGEATEIPIGPIPNVDTQKYLRDILMNRRMMSHDKELIMAIYAERRWVKTVLADNRSKKYLNVDIRRTVKKAREEKEGKSKEDKKEKKNPMRCIRKPMKDGIVASGWAEVIKALETVEQSI